jgi:prolyl oligopeptidase
LPSLGTVSFTGGHNESELFYRFTSFTDPGSIFRVDLNTFAQQKISQSKLPIKTDDLITDQVWFTSKDGTKVPMFMVRKKDVLASPNDKPNKPIPTVLHGYGGFNTVL